MEGLTPQSPEQIPKTPLGEALFKVMGVGKNKIVRRQLYATDEDIASAEKIVQFYLGDEFAVDYTSMPKNVGVLGDEGVDGHTVLVFPRDPGNYSNYLDVAEGGILETVAQEIVNETGGACRVLFEFYRRYPPGEHVYPPRKH